MMVHSPRRSRGIIIKMHSDQIPLILVVCQPGSHMTSSYVVYEPLMVCHLWHALWVVWQYSTLCKIYRNGNSISKSWNWWYMQMILMAEMSKKYSLTCQHKKLSSSTSQWNNGSSDRKLWYVFMDNFPICYQLNKQYIFFCSYKLASRQAHLS